MIIAGTGHRPDKLGGYSPKAFERCVNVAERWLVDQTGIEYVISGMALGWDQALAVAAMQCYIPFHAYVPFYGQESKWPKLAQENYHKLLSKAAKVDYVSDGGYSGHKMQLRNMAMVNDCTHVLALWNGSSGGTANCVAYAKLMKRPIINLWDTFVGQP